MVKRIVLCTIAITSAGRVMDVTAGQVTIPESATQCVAQVFGREMTIISVEGKVAHRETRANVALYGAQFMPDGRHYIGRTQAGIAKVSLSGEVSWDATHLLNAHSISVASSGKEIALVAKNTKTKFQGLQLITIDESTTCNISDDGVKPSWSRDSAKLVFAAGDTLMMYDRHNQKSSVWGEGTDPTWAPDGRIAFRNKQGDFVLRDDSKEDLARLFDGRKILTPLFWSPDGRYLMFVEEGGGAKGGGLDCLEPKQVMLYEVSTRERRSLYQLCKSAPYSFAWATGDLCSLEATGTGVEKK